MAKKKYLLSLDAGIGGGRCVISDVDGNEVASSYQEWTYVYPPEAPGGVELNPRLFWDILCGQIKKAVAKAKISSHQIAGISSTSMREGNVLLDGEGKELFACPPMDNRGSAEAGEINEKFGEKIYRINGRFPMIHAPCRLWWFKRHKPKLYRRISTILMINDWIAYKLSGKCSSEPSNASSSGVLDVHKIQWSGEIMDMLDLPPNIWPEIYENGSQIGEVTEAASAKTGLKKGTPVIAGGGDAQCATVGTASVRAGRITAISGTTTPIQMVLTDSVVDEKMRTWTNCHVVSGQWVLESNAGLTGYAYRWYRDAIAILEHQIHKEVDIDPYQLMDKKAERVPPGSNGVMTFLGSGIMNARNWVSTPGSILGIRPMYPETTGRKQIIRAILECTCYAIRGNVEQLEEISKTKIKELRFCGGAAKSSLWTQIQADVLGKEVYVPSIKEATALGAIICAGVGVGIYSSIADAAESVVRWETVRKPKMNVHKTYNGQYKKWKAVFNQLIKLTEAKLLTPAIF